MIPVTAVPAAFVWHLIFAEIPDIWVWIGGLLIVAATTHLARREGGAARARAPVR